MRLFLALTIGLASVLSSPAQSVYTTPYFFSLFAGASSIGTADGPGATARFFQPGGMATDASGNIFIADTGNHTIRKISVDGTVSTFAGLAGIKGSADGTGSGARFNGPSAVAVDSSGNVYVADSGNSTIRKITPAAVVTTIAGSPGEKGNTDGIGVGARFQEPLGITATADGTLYVADDCGESILSYNRTEATESLVRKITPAGVVTTFARGLGKGIYRMLQQSYKPRFDVITSDANGNVLVASTVGTHSFTEYTFDVDVDVIRYTPAGDPATILTITETLNDYNIGYPAFAAVTGLLVDSSGSLTVATPQSKQISKFDLTAPVDRRKTVLWQETGSGAVSNLLGSQLRLTLNRDGNLNLLDSDENVLRRLVPNQSLTVVAGLAASDAERTLDGKGGAARVRAPTGSGGLGVDGAGNLLLTSDQVVRKISPDGTVATLAGRVGESGAADGPADVARFWSPGGVVADSSGTIYMADSGNSNIRKISATGDTITFAGAGLRDHKDGPGYLAQFVGPGPMAFDRAGILYVNDLSALRKISPSADVSTLVVTSEGRQVTLGGASMVIDASGNIYNVGYSHSISKVSPDGIFTTLTGEYLEAGSVDGKLAAARFSYPTGLAFDAHGNLFVADRGNNVIRMITPEGDVSTVGGVAGVNTNTDGTGDRAHFVLPERIVVDATGNLYVWNKTAIMKGVRGASPVISAQPASQSVAAGGTVQLSVTAGGVPEPTYQWYVNGGVFAGANSSTLGFSNARSTDAGDYTVVVTNSLGSITSAKATISVGAASTPVPVPSPASGGGGAMGMWFGCVLVALGSVRFFNAQASAEQGKSIGEE